MGFGRNAKIAAMAMSTFAVMAGVAAISGLDKSSAQDTLERIREQGFARIGMANEPPYTQVKADGSVTGAGPELARVILGRLGVKEIVPTISEYGAMIPALEAGRFDISVGSLFITPQRCEAIAFGEPELCDAEGFLVKAGNPLQLQSFEDIARHPDARIGAPGGGTEERLALAAGVPRDRVIAVPDGQSGVKMLQNGRIDVYSLPVMSLKDLFTRAEDPGIEVVEKVEDSPVYCGAAAFRKGDIALRDAYDEVLAELKSSGEMDKILEPFGLSADLAKETTRDQLCSAAN